MVICAHIDGLISMSPLSLTQVTAVTHTRAGVVASTHRTRVFAPQGPHARKTEPQTSSLETSLLTGRAPGRTAHSTPAVTT